jgi:hypothetical protein
VVAVAAVVVEVGVVVLVAIQILRLSLPQDLLLSFFFLLLSLPQVLPLSLWGFSVLEHSQQLPRPIPYI